MGATSEPCGPPSRPPSPLGPDLSRVARHPDCSRQAEQCEEFTTQHLLGWMGRPGGWPSSSRVACSPRDQSGGPGDHSGGSKCRSGGPGDEASRVSTQPSSHPAVQPTTPPRSQPTSCPARQTENQPLGCRSLAASSPGIGRKTPTDFQTDPYRVFGNCVYEKYKNGGTSWAEKRA